VKKALEVREKNVDEDTELRSLKKIADFKTKRESWDIDGFTAVPTHPKLGSTPLK
jgi:hypothetical protein